MRRATILAFVGCYLPGFRGGGPIRTVANLVGRLHDEFGFRIVTDDRDHGDGRPYEGVQLDQWLWVGTAEVYYASRRSQTLRGFGDLLRQVPYDVLYLNSLFSPRFTLLPLVIRRLGLAPRRPVVLAPRGELGQGALALKSLKKRAFLRVASLLGLYKNIVWQASTDHEAQRIIELMNVSADRVFVAPNLPAHSQGSAQGPPKTGMGSSTIPTILFLSRIARMKNLDFAIRTLAEVTAPVDFLIYGTIEDEAYWAECQKLIATAPSHVRISYEGELPHDRVHEAFERAQLFFLPTRGENYGHAIIEALSAGLPVLISDQTPWGDIHDEGAGWALPLDETSSFAAVIDGWATETPQARINLSRRASAYAQKVTGAEEAIEANVRMFQAALGLLSD